MVFPAQFTLVASTNPCPCGFYGDLLQPCSCSPRSRENYWSRLSGPLMDRIDLQVVVNRIKPEEMTQHQPGEASDLVRQRVQRARQRAQERFQQEPKLQCNADMQSRHLKQWCPLDDSSRILLEGAMGRLFLSARAADRILKVARTIADLDDQDRLQTQHLAEAVQYRTLDRLP